MDREVPKSKIDLPVVDFRNHGPLTMDRFHICKRRLRVKEEFLPRIRRTFSNERHEPYSGYKTQRPFVNQPKQEKNPIAVERTKQAVEIFQKSDELMLKILKEELEQRNGLKKWWEPKTDAEDEIADNHYFDLKRLFNEVEEEIHQKYWIEDDWAKLWDHATSKHGHLPMKW